MIAKWIKIFRMALELSRAIHEATREECPNVNCPLGYNKKKVVERKLTQDELIRKHEEMYRRNHPNDK